MGEEPTLTWGSSNWIIALKALIIKQKTHIGDKCEAPRKMHEIQQKTQRLTLKFQRYTLWGPKQMRCPNSKHLTRTTPSYTAGTNNNHTHRVFKFVTQAFPSTFYYIATFPLFSFTTNSEVPTLQGINQIPHNRDMRKEFNLARTVK